jgi:hypothetical protein
MSIRMMAAFALKQLTETKVPGSNLPATISIRLFIDAPSVPLGFAWLRPVDQQLSIDMSLKGGAACVAYLPTQWIMTAS